MDAAPTDTNWYLDSGATHHLTNDMSNLSMAEPFTGTSKLVIGNGVGLFITHTGSAVLRIQSSINHSDLKLNNILLVPKITKNLISISKLTRDNDVVIEFTNDFCFVKDKVRNLIMLQGKVEKGLYKLLLVSLNRTSHYLSNQGLLAHVQSAVSTQPISMFFAVDSKCQNKIASQLHTEAQCSQNSDCMLSTLVLQQRLGHPNARVLSHVINSCPSFKTINGNKSFDSCNACKLGKMYKLHFPVTETKTKNALELLHTDLWGPAPTLSIQGYKYYISFVDDYTRFTWIFPLKTKAEAFQVFKVFKTQVEKQLDKSIKCLQSDWGGEYRSFVHFLQTEGIQFRHSCPYTHNQNGLVERKHRHITEFGLTLLAQAKLPIKFWWDLFHTATHIINRFPTPVLSLKTPYEYIFHQKTRLSFSQNLWLCLFSFFKRLQSSQVSFSFF